MSENTLAGKTPADMPADLRALFTQLGAGAYPPAQFLLVLVTPVVSGATVPPGAHPLQHLVLGHDVNPVLFACAVQSLVERGMESGMIQLHSIEERGDDAPILPGTAAPTGQVM